MSATNMGTHTNLVSQSHSVLNLNLVGLTTDLWFSEHLSEVAVAHSGFRRAPHQT